MTFKEKWELDHPGEKFSLTAHGTESWRCPYKCGYEKVDADSAHCEMGCTACWNREMPSLKAATMAFGNHEVEVPYSGRKPIEYVNTAEFANTEPHILDSGERREFATGAVRDIQEGKGRPDLMPMRVLAYIWRTIDPDYADKGVDKARVFEWIADFMDTGDTKNLIFAINSFTGYLDWPTAFLEVSKHFEEGAKKYGENNWQKGLPVNCYINSALRHYLKWLRGDTDEPHDRAFVWNLLCCIWEIDFSPRAKEKDREFNMDDVLVKHVVGREPEPGVLYVCNRKPCETCRSDCHCTERIDSAAMLELNCRDVRYEDCPVGLFLHPVDGVFLKTEGLNAAFHVGLGLSRKFEADTMVTPIKYMFEERERE